MTADNPTRFNAALCKTYRAIRARGHAFEVVFASVDRCFADYRLFRATMPWPVLPYGDMREALLSQT